MKILEYDEVDAQQVLDLNLTAFGWSLTPDRVKNIRKLDKSAPVYFALYAVEKNEVLSQVSAVTIDTKTIHGAERIGFIWGVCTKPSSARQGLAKRLMLETQSRLLADKIRYSFLTTAKSFVAYDLYEQLGYRDITDMPWGIKICCLQHQSERDKHVSFVPVKKDNLLAELFSNYSRGLLGFVYRPKHFLEVKKAWTGMFLNTSGIFRENNKPIGYVLGDKEGKFFRIRELCCPKVEDMRKCINALEIKFKPQYITFGSVSRSCLAEAFCKSGFRLVNESWGTLMVKDLKGYSSKEDIEKLYGRDSDRFQVTFSIDTY